jgi:hypothetical protein
MLLLTNLKALIIYSSANWRTRQSLDIDIPFVKKNIKQ